MMQLPRKSTLALSKSRGKSSTAKKKKAPTSRAKRGERLLLTCAPIVSSYMMEDLAQTLHGMMLTDPDGRYWQVVAVRVDERYRKVYGKCQEMYEAAPYMFAPVS
jgi:hypothetical protein